MNSKEVLGYALHRPRTAVFGHRSRQLAIRKKPDRTPALEVNGHDLHCFHPSEQHSLSRQFENDVHNLGQIDCGQMVAQ